MSAVEIREPTVADAPGITEVINAHSVAIHGEPDLTEPEVRHWFAAPNIWIRVASRNGTLAGYVDVADDHRDGSRFNVDARPLDPETARSLVAAAEAYARAAAAPNAIVRGYVAAADEASRVAYLEAGYRLIRHSFRMGIDLAGAQPSPVWPAECRVGTFEGELDAVYAAYADAFADAWDFHPEGADEFRRWNLERPGFDPSLWLLARERGEIVGFALGRPHASGVPEHGWISLLGVRPPWRRRGLALALLRYAFSEFASRGCSRVELGVDAENTSGAVRLYEKAGMAVVWRTDTYEKQL